MSAGKRLGNDPFAHRGAPSADSGAQALRRILAPAQPPEQPRTAPDGASFESVAARFAEAMEQLSRLASEQPFGQQCGQPGQGGVLPFMRLMAAYRVQPQAQGVDASAFLRDVRDQFDGCELDVRASFGSGLLPVQRVFNLALGLSAALERRDGAGAGAAIPVRLDGGVLPDGGVSLRLCCRRADDPHRLAGFRPGHRGELERLAREGALSVIRLKSAGYLELMLRA